MTQLYEESAGLPQVSLDSIKSFTAKFGSYVVCRPESRQDEYYQPTLDNINYAASLYGCRLVELSTGVTVNTDWRGERHLTY